jgi:hypothetical protein
MINWCQKCEFAEIGTPCFADWDCSRHKQNCDDALENCDIALNLQKEIYKREYQIAVDDIKEKDTMYFEEAEYDSWFNFLTDSYDGDNIKVYEEVISDMGEYAIKKMWLENHIK